MKRLLAFLALCLPVYILAQGFGSFTHDQPYFSADRGSGGGGESGTNILFLYPGIYRWWVSSDVPTNHSVSNQWLDRIAGAVMGQGDPAKQPTNSSLGIHFDKTGNTILTNVPLGNMDGDDMILFIAQVDAVPGEFQYWFNGEANAGFFWIIPQVNSGGTWSTPAGNFGDRPSAGPMPDNVLFDFHWYDCDFYTNGVLNKLNYPNNWLTPKLQYLGAKSDFTLPANGYLREIVIWTNVGFGHPIGASVVSNLHYYSTNRYPITP